MKKSTKKFYAILLTLQRKAFLCDDPAADQHGEWRIYADSCA